ncbi:MAG: nitroreductase family deazaflavin-dependent oxidoreductase [Actinomycetota bacterium]
MPLPGAVARFNRYVTNPIARRVAGWAPGFCILEHVGRRSGRRYRIPLNLCRADGGFVFALTYGPDTDWVKNVMAAGGCSIRHRRRHYGLTRPRFLPTEEGMSHMPPPVRAMLRLVGVTEFLRMDCA